MRIVRYFFCAVALAMAAISLSCAVFSDCEKVSFVLPVSCRDVDVPEWTVWVAGGDSDVSVFKAPGGKRVEMTAHKSRVCAVLAVPVNAYPSEWGTGAIYPYSDDFSEQDTFAANVAVSLYMASENSAYDTREYLSFFNWKRFMEALRDCEDPWLLNKEKIMQDIARGSFTLNSIRLRQDDSQ
ncbi:MAG: hypothetical protein J1F14_00165 [Treponema sp.]|nr:hypothetical protein [Treponema sp.]